MRIVFICGSLQPSRNGVGDYTRRLGIACQQLGNEIALVALHDHWVSQWEETTQHGWPQLRLPAKPLDREQIIRAREWIARKEPDWVSLQFVPYTFHPKGLPWTLAQLLRLLGGSVKWHIMFHELWIGESVGYGLRDRSIGFLQKLLVRRLLHQLRPSAVHTSNPVYGELLRRNGIVASELPLFGNVPLATCDREWFRQAMRDHAIAKDQSSRDTFWFGAIFGSIHPQWSARPWLDELCSAASQSGRRLVLLQMGHTPNSGRMVWEKIRTDFAGKCDFVSFGGQPPDRISTLLQMLDFGISTSPGALVGKSGTVATMLEHGLPVLVTRNDWQPRGWKINRSHGDPLVVFAQPNTKIDLLALIQSRRSPQNLLNKVAEQFLCDLKRT